MYKFIVVVWFFDGIAGVCLATHTLILLRMLDVHTHTNEMLIEVLYEKLSVRIVIFCWPFRGALSLFYVLV